MFLRRSLSLLVVVIALLGAVVAQARPAAVADEQSAANEEAAASALNHLRDGLEAHSQRLLLASFDGEHMEGFLSFSDQIEAYFTRYESFRIVYHILQVSPQDDRIAVLADVTVENTPRGGGRVTRRQGQLRLVLGRVAKGWKIVDVTPRGFFF